jgi:hypothetical protein
MWLEVEHSVPTEVFALHSTQSIIGQLFVELKEEIEKER